MPHRAEDGGATDSPASLFAEIQRKVGWAEGDPALLAAARKRLEPTFPAIVEDFYRAPEADPETAKVITGGPEQVDRLKRTLLDWLGDLLAGRYGPEYAERRWRVGRRHVEIGLRQVDFVVALARVRDRLASAVWESWEGPPERLPRTLSAIHRVLDLDLALIGEAYRIESATRQQQVERLAAIGQVAGGVAHELRNPLNVVKTSVYYLLNARASTPEKRAEHLGRIERHVELADGVITALTNFARMPVPSPVPFRVGECVAEALTHHPRPEGVAVVAEGMEALPPAVGDSRQVQIIVGNLARNAFEAMQGEGTLTIRGATDAGGEAVEVAFSDTGPGIPRELLARIMEPFYTTKARGLGLGLAISRTIAERNGGEIRVASEPGGGSTFVLRLRAAGSGPKGAETAPGQGESSP